MSVVHENIDPMTGNCLDCGATREALEDNLFPECAKFTGPHRLALIAIHQAKGRAIHGARFADQLSDMARAEARQAEDRAAFWSKKAAEERQASTELQASLEYLLGPVERKLSVAEAINRTHT